jgi:hypothetical protein
MFSVDLIINCYEGTQEKVLSKIFIHEVLNQNKYNFKNVFIVINNVRDKRSIAKKAGKLKKEGVINGYFFVEDYIDKVLKFVKIKKGDLEPILHYSDWALVSIYISKSAYLLHWDPDVYLERSIDWVSPSLDKMMSKRSFMVASPLLKGSSGVMRHESYQEDENYFYNDDFSDQIFLVRKKDFLRPIYGHNHIYSLRFPLAHIGSVFEKRIDSYMKRQNKIRIIFKKVPYLHLKNNGFPYPKTNIFRVCLHYIFMVIVIVYYHTFLSIKKMLLRL